MNVTADVVIPVYRGVEMTRDCIVSVLEHSGPALGRVIVVEDCGPEPEMRPMLRALRDEHPSIRLIENERNLGFVESCNRGLSLRAGHVVALNSDTRVTDGWLEELLGVLEAAPRVAAVCPLSNNATLCSVPEYVSGSDASRVDPRRLRLDRLPRWTEMPTVVGFCVLFRDEALSLLGGLDPAFGRGYHEENDWAQRAQARGLSVARANRAFVYHFGSMSFGAQRSALDLRNGRRLVARYPNYLAQNQAFERGSTARVAAIAARASHGRLRVRVDLGQSEREPAWLNAAQHEGSIEITVTRGPPEPGATFDIVHRLGEPSLEEACALLESSAHLVVTWGDTYLFRAPGARGDWGAIERARAAWLLLLEAAQGVIVPSEFAAEELTAALPGSRPRVIPLAIARPEARPLPMDDTFVHLAEDGLRDNEALLVDAFTVAQAEVHRPLTLLLSAPGNSAGLPSGVRRVSRDAAEQALRRARAAIVLDACSGDGSSVLRGLTAGVPVLALAAGAAREVLAGSKLLLERLTLTSLSEAIRARCTDTAAGEDEVLRTVLERHDPAKVAVQTIETWREVALAPSLASLQARSRLIQLLRAIR